MTNSDSTLTSKVKSTHVVETFVLPPLVSHPNADLLSIAKIAETDFTYVAATKDWSDHINKLVCWIPPDSIVDSSRKEFAFLGNGGPVRVRAKKIRGINSYGILVLAPEGLKPGDNASEVLGVTHYDPEILQQVENIKNPKKKNMSPIESTTPPSGDFPKYDVDAFLRYSKKVFKEGEIVVVTEKIHGANAKYTFKDGIMYCGSREEWKSEFSSAPKITLEELTANIGDAVKAQEVYNRIVIGHRPKKNMWWSVLDSIPQIRQFCEKHPGWCIYGEVFGNIKNFKYNAAENQILFRAFDILVPSNPIQRWVNSRWLNSDEFISTCDEAGIPRVPVLGIIPYNFDTIVSMAEGNTTLVGAKEHIREGCVVKPIIDRWDHSLGRVSLKLVSPQFLALN